MYVSPHNTVTLAVEGPNQPIIIINHMLTCNSMMGDFSQAASNATHSNKTQVYSTVITEDFVLDNTAYQNSESICGPYKICPRATVWTTLL